MSEKCIKKFIEPNGDFYLKKVIKCSVCFMLLICNILFYYHFAIFSFGELLADIIFWLFLCVLLLTFTVDYHWLYNFSDRTLLIKLTSNLIGFNSVVIKSNGKILKREVKFGMSAIEFNIDNFPGISRVVLKKSDDNRILCRLEE